VLVDGFVRATWTLTAAKSTARLTVYPADPLDDAEEAAVRAEGAALLGFLAPQATGETTVGR
jgi:hypothetical protein